MEKSATTSVTWEVCVSPPLVAVIVSRYVPPDVELEVLIERVEERPSPGVIEVALKLGVAPDGKPVTLKLTLPLNPLTGVTFTV